MINFSAIPQNSLLGKFLRGILKLIPKNAVLPILQGKLRGKKWIVGSGIFGYWLETYELKKQKLFIEAVKKGDVVYDIGAHVGFYTLLVSTLVGSEGKVFAFEPLPENIFFLKKHLSLNRCRNVEVVEAAVSDENGKVSFQESVSSSSGQVFKSGKLNVKAIMIDDLVARKIILPPNVMKIDVEGHEYSVLLGAAAVLRKYHPVVFLALDNGETRKNCLELLLSIGYKIDLISGENIERAEEVIAKI